MILSSVFDFRICFGEILVEQLIESTFGFDDKFKQSAAQITMLYHVSKGFLCLQLAVDQYQDMTWKWKNADFDFGYCLLC